MPGKFSGGTFKIMTPSGQILKKGIIQTNLMTIDVKNLTTGIYFVEVITNKGDTEYKKIVVMH